MQADQSLTTDGTLPDIVARLRSVPPFSHLTAAQVASLLPASPVQEAPAGAVLTAADDAARDYLVLLQGEVEESWHQEGVAAHRRFRASAQTIPRVISAAVRGTTIVAQTAVVYSRVNGNRLDEMMSVFGFGDADPDVVRRLHLFAQTSAFRRLPLENVRNAVQRMRPVDVAAGDVIVRQGGKGDLYFVIETGEAEVWRTDAFTDETWLAARVGPGDVFGEEALLTGGFRANTVTMTAPGRLWTLAAADFDELVKPSLVLEVEPAHALAQIDAGTAHWLDCRYDMEYDEFHLPGARSIPLEVLRRRATELDPNATYIVYCRSGRRSRCAAYLLRERNINAYSLIGGIRDWPYGGETPAGS